MIVIADIDFGELLTVAGPVRRSAPRPVTESRDHHDRQVACCTEWWLVEPSRTRANRSAKAFANPVEYASLPHLVRTGSGYPQVHFGTGGRTLGCSGPARRP